MRVEAINIEKTKNEAKKYILNKIPLASKIFQFNSFIGDIKLEYIEFKVLKYEIISRQKNNRIFKSELKKEIIARLTDKLKSGTIDKINIQINIVDIKSIYKPYWVVDFRGRNVFIDS